jgi:predicted MFS family arabinose efflux permease
MGWRADHRIGGHFRVVVLMLLGGAVGLVGLSTAVEPVFVGSALLAFGAGWAWPGVFNLAVVAHNRRSAAAATGVTQAGTYSGSALGPLGFGYVVTRVGYRPAWLGLAVVAVAAAGVIDRGRVVIEGGSRLADGVPVGDR